MPEFVSFVEGVDVGLEWKARITSIAQAFLLENKHVDYKYAHNVGIKISWISAEMICAMITGINDPCLCQFIEIALFYAVEQNHLNCSVVGNKKRFFLP